MKKHRKNYLPFSPDSPVESRPKSTRGVYKKNEISKKLKKNEKIPQKPLTF